MHHVCEVVVVCMCSDAVEPNKATLLNIGYWLIQKNNTKHRNEDTQIVKR